MPDSVPVIQQPTLIQFENIRKTINYIPPITTKEEDKGVVFEVGKGLVELKNIPKSIDNNNYKNNLELEIYDRTVNSGYGEFEIKGFVNDGSLTYSSLYINKKSTLNVQGTISLDSKSDISSNNKIPPSLIIDGKFIMNNNSILKIKEGEVIFSKDSKVTFPIGSKLIIDVPDNDNNYYVYINCDLEIDFSQIDQFINNKHVFISDDVNVIVNNLPGGRLMSVTDWVTELNKKVQNVNTVGIANLSNSSKVSYRWRAGSPDDQSDALQLSLDKGDIILGDFDLRLTGIPVVMKPNQQIITDMIVQKDARLFIIDKLQNGMQYILPRIHITKFNSDIIIEGTCQVFGKIVCNGSTAGIEINKGCKLLIEEGGSVQITNHAFIQNINSEDLPLIIVKGELIIDDFESFKNINPNNIVIQDNGKVIILNPSPIDENERKLLFSTPISIMGSDLYHYFGNRLNQVEYHVQKNCGIKIDEFYEYYSYMKWYNHLVEPMDIFQAIEKGYIIWHDGGFIELDHNIIPYIDETSNLSIVGEVFNTYGSSAEKVQQTAVNFMRSGSGDVMFRFVNGNEASEYTMSIKSTKIIRALYNTVTSKYRVYTEGDGGEIYVNNNFDISNPSSILDDKAQKFPIDESNITEFSIDDKS